MSGSKMLGNMVGRLSNQKRRTAMISGRDLRCWEQVKSPLGALRVQIALRAYGFDPMDISFHLGLFAALS